MIAPSWLTPGRIEVLSRVVAASLGGYALVNLGIMAFTFLLPWERYQALLFSLQTSFVVYTLVIIWAFAAASARRVWLGLGIVALPLALVDLYFRFQGGLG